MSTSNTERDPNSVVIATYISEVSQPGLESKAWDACEPVRIEHYWSGAPAPATRHAEVRLCWTDAALLARFVCEQNEPLVVAQVPRTVLKTIGLWDRDVCEVFLTLNLERPHRYYEFEVAPTGEWIDLGIDLTPQGRETDWDYTSGMKAVAEIGERKVRVGMTIPWSDDLARPQRGDRWGTNLFRCVGADEATRYLAWRPTRTAQPNFHVPAAFGIVKFE